MLLSRRYLLLGLLFSFGLLLCLTDPGFVLPESLRLRHPFSGNHTSHRLGTVDWPRFAYVQYVTTTPYLCNSVMLFERLQHLGSKADRLLMYPSSLNVAGESMEGQLLRKARDEYGAKLESIEMQHKSMHDRKS